MPRSVTKLRLAQLLLVGTALTLITYKVVVHDDTRAALLPPTTYEVAFSMTVEGTGAPIEAAMYLPQSNGRQEILRAEHGAGLFAFETARDVHGLQGRWSAEALEGSHTLRYTAQIRSSAVRYTIPDELTVPATVPEGLRPYLASTPYVQVDDPSIAARFAEITPPTNHVAPLVRSLFDYVQGLEPMPFRGRTDAVTAERLGKASCNGKSRLFLAMARRAGLPGRLVGGLIMTEGQKRVSHQWVELYLAGEWVPFDALNNHYASLPAHYLTLYYGDAYLFTHTPNIAFTYQFSIDHTRESPLLYAERYKPLTLFQPYRLWGTLVDLGVPLSLLKTLLMLPLGALLVVLFRNVVGLETFGVFLPALVAVSCFETGLLWGLVGFVGITAVVGLAHGPLDRWGVLFTPKMSILLLLVVGLMLALLAVSVQMGHMAITTLTLLPVVILSVTAERFAHHVNEEGLGKALRVMASTGLVIAACYLVTTLPAVQLSILAFPELLLVVGAAKLSLGRWIGLRVTEYTRFRWLADADRPRAERWATLREHAMGINHRNGAVIAEANPRSAFVVADDKHVTKTLLESHGLPVPPTHAVVERIGDIQATWEQIATLDRFVVKPARGRAGNNILVLERDGDTWRSPSGRPYDAAAIQKAIADIIFGIQSHSTADKAIVEYRVEPHPFFADLYQGGLADLRVLMHHGSLVQAMVRLPTDASDGKANLHQGALGIGVNTDTGCLTQGYDYVRFADTHPDTGHAFAGQPIPYWGEIRSICAQVSELVALKYLGIDIVLDAYRGPLVMEINARPGLEIQNVNRQGLRPLLTPPARLVA